MLCWAGAIWLYWPSTIITFSFNIVSYVMENQDDNDDDDDDASASLVQAVA